VEAGAQCIQLFDSWGGQLTPEDWELWSKPYIQKVSISSALPIFFIFFALLPWSSFSSVGS